MASNCNVSLFFAPPSYPCVPPPANSDPRLCWADRQVPGRADRQLPAGGRRGAGGRAAADTHLAIPSHQPEPAQHHCQPQPVQLHDLTGHVAALARWTTRQWRRWRQWRRQRCLQEEEEEAKDVWFKCCSRFRIWVIGQVSVCQTRNFDPIVSFPFCVTVFEGTSIKTYIYK